MTLADVAGRSDDDVGERADLDPRQSHRQPLKLRERAAAGAVEVDVPLEEHERGVDREVTLDDVARGERQEAVGPVPAEDVEADEPPKRDRPAARPRRRRGGYPDT